MNNKLEKYVKYYLVYFHLIYFFIVFDIIILDKNKIGE